MYPPGHAGDVGPGVALADEGETVRGHVEFRIVFGFLLVCFFFRGGGGGGERR